jgi:hypothetical protein
MISNKNISLFFSVLKQKRNKRIQENQIQRTSYSPNTDFLAHARRET